MILERVLPHQYRDDIFIDQVITPHEKVKEVDKIIINRMLLREIAIIQ